MGEIGLRAYRFSISWSRIFPTGVERAPCEAGLAFYERLVDGLLEAGIEPWVTLYHWDLPQGLENAGGWPERDTVHAYVRYVDAVTKRLGDRVHRWITQNEPWSASMLGYQSGLHAPGKTRWPLALAAAHHLLLAHGLAVSVIRGNARASAIGISLNLIPAYPISGSDEDHAAAVHFDGHVNRWFLDPLYGRGYPADIVQAYARRHFIPASGVPEVRPGDMETIAAPFDFLGVNYFTRALVKTGGSAMNLRRDVGAPVDQPVTDNGWEISPRALTDLLKRLGREYPGIPFYITENGAAYHSDLDGDGRIADLNRVAFLYEHLQACWRAIQAGVPVRGYFVWSLFDHFEWTQGYSQQFGIVHVDRDTQERTLKDSALWYRLVIRGNTLMNSRK